MSDKMTYEQALKKLEDIIDTLEKNEISLDESLELYAQGTKLVAFCSDKLDSAKQKIIEIEKE